MKILTFIQTNDGKINNNSLESLVAAQKIAQEKNGELHAIVFDNNAANQLENYKLDSIMLAENPELQNYNPIYYLKTLELICKEIDPDLFIFGHSYETRDWVPRLSARLDIPFISDCTSFDDELNFIRPIFQAKLNEKVSLNNKGIISFQSGSYSIDSLVQGNTSINKSSFDLSSINLNVRPGEKFRESANEVDLSTAEIIVSIGRGIAKEENIPIVENLAEKLNAQIAASRPVVDSGWLDHSRQVGSSGQTVSPKLYLSIGISGAIQHLVGMKGSKNIIAINKDPNAPIFEIADYAVIGDLFEILPKLTEQL